MVNPETYHSFRTNKNFGMEGNMKESPDKILAKKIVTILHDQKLVSEKKTEKLEKDYAAGNLSSEEWIMLVESELKEVLTHDQKD